MIGTEHINKIECMNSGGHVMIDLIHLKSGKVIGISTDVIVLYPSWKAFEENSGEDYPYIELF